MRKLQIEKFALTGAYFSLVILILCGIAVNHAWSQSPAPDPCEALEEIAPCPCNYSDVPQTSECWSNSPLMFQSCDGIDCKNTPTDICTLFNLPAGEPELGMGTDSTVPTDQVCFILKTANCGISDDFHTNLNPAEINTCLCRLAQYTNELAQNTDIQIDPQLDTYTCQPTLGEGEGNDSTAGSSCSLASSNASNASLPVYLLIPAFILIAKLWRRGNNQKHS